MVPVQDVLDAAAEAAIIATPPWGASGPTIRLVIQPFTPSPSLILTDLTLQSFTGSSPGSMTDANPNFGRDPVSGDFIGTLQPPPGGWSWEVGNTDNLPQTVYGWALVDDPTPTTLLATELIDPPITLQQVGDRVDLGPIRTRLTPLFLS